LLSAPVTLLLSALLTLGLTQEQIRSIQILPVDYEIEYICRENRVIVGPKVRKCLPNGTWTDMTQHSSCRKPRPSCDIHLITLSDNVLNGPVLPPSGPPVEGTVLHYSCHAGFILEGRNSSLCTKLGKWDAPKPTCLCEYCKTTSRGQQSNHKSISHKVSCISRKIQTETKPQGSNMAARLSQCSEFNGAFPH
uniref:Sushi domain-containing protein n=1 Tax=Periophthalmus magnuspinnatus TaxID=409849 RepID=A0A3B3Z701_9GOBI